MMVCMTCTQVPDRIASTMTPAKTSSADDVADTVGEVRWPQQPRRQFAI